MTVVIGIVAFIAAFLLGQAQASQGRTIASYAAGGQLLAITLLLSLGERYQEPLGLFIAGTLLGALAAFGRGRRRAR
ncbi:hypothetical protein GCM10025782_29840 [Pedococcus ginsenosidimutans]|uniref:NADP transhydrogenase beta-like domain-containing protein n=1 Tax=Pedococcus ginsenosidimutans TaxID=490570 RepID=A0ABP8YIX3_9MICO